MREKVTTVLYRLMNKDVVIATFEEEKRLDAFRYTLVEQLDPYLPHGFATIDD